MIEFFYNHPYVILSIQGRLYQIEYAMEAVKQGAATVALKSKTHVVLCALKVMKYDSVIACNHIRSLASTFGIISTSEEDHVHR